MAGDALYVDQQVAGGGVHFAAAELNAAGGAGGSNVKAQNGAHIRLLHTPGLDHLVCAADGLLGGLEKQLDCAGKFMFQRF